MALERGGWLNGEGWHGREEKKTNAPPQNFHLSVVTY